MDRSHIKWSGVAVLLLCASAVWAAERRDVTPLDEAPLTEAPLPGDEPLPSATSPSKASPSKAMPQAEAPLPSDVTLTSATLPATTLPATMLPEETPLPETTLLDATPGVDAESAASAKAAPRDKLVIGDAYMLEVKRGGVTRTFGGNLLKATDKWIVLRRVAAGRNDYGIPLLSALPKVGTMFRRSYESLVEDDLWIPREAATIESHRQVKSAATTKPVLGSEPPTRSRCGVAYGHGEKFVLHEGELTAIAEDKVTLLTTGIFYSQYHQKIARGDLFCISIPVVLSNVRMTERDSSQARK